MLLINNLKEQNIILIFFTFKLIDVVKHKKKLHYHNTTKKKLHYICSAKICRFLGYNFYNFIYPRN